MYRVVSPTRIGETSSSAPQIPNRRRSSCIGTHGRLLMNRRSWAVVHVERGPSKVPAWPPGPAGSWTGAIATVEGAATGWAPLAPFSESWCGGGTAATGRACSVVRLDRPGIRGAGVHGAGGAFGRGAGGPRRGT